MIKGIIAALDIVNQFLPTILGSVSSSYIHFLISIKYIYLDLLTNARRSKLLSLSFYNTASYDN